MQNSSKFSALLLAAGMMLAGNLPAQQTPAASTPTATKTPATSTTPKTHTGTATSKATTGPVALTTQKQKQSYAVGMSLGEILKRQSVGSSDVDLTVLTRALRDSLADKKPALTEEQFKEVMTTFTAELRKRATEKEEAEGKKNKAVGDAYLEANKTKPGVVTLPSGLQYKVLQAGSGPKPRASDSVVCNYRGTFTDGKEFDSSYKRGEPATFPVSGVIKGWTEALQLMPTGSKWQLVIPPNIAYGERGRPGIPPNSTLVFEVELVKIAEKEKPAEPAAAQPQGTSEDKSKPEDPQAKPQ